MQQSINLYSTTKSLFILLFLCFALTVSGNNRVKTDIGAGWKFNKTTVSTASKIDYNDSSWPTINIPHTWNDKDAQDGGGNYARTIGWYRKSIPWNASYAGKRVYLEILAASLQAECFVNETSVATHKGGYNAFRFDITDQLTTTGDNLIAIKVDNRSADDICPLSGDFSFIGGIYRKIFLVVADPVHVDLNDNGTHGLYLTTSNVSAASATLEIKAKVVNESSEAKTVNLKAIFRHPDTFEAIAEVPNPIFNINDMKPGGSPIETLEENAVNIPAGGFFEFNKQITVTNPHLWNGKTDPYRYLVDFSVSDADNVIDAVSDYVGFRFFRADNTGFYLNGNLYPLRGVNRHQDWEDMGYAISENEHNIDFGMIYEIGANAVRMAHYPQDPYFHELFDKYGIAVWVEIPFVDKFGSDTTKFMETTRTQLREMIRQRYNRPSILMWGLQNEVSTGNYDAQMSKIIPVLNNFAHAEDPSRLTVQAQAGSDRSNWTTDLFAKNQYPGWYQSGTVGSYMDGYKNKHYTGGKYYPVGLSEYGAGGNPDQHEIVTGTPNTSVATTSQWHPEEYQSRVHEQSVKDIASREWIWGTFLWNMFDFASDSRNEGSKPGINDKGLVTHDRRIKKDSYYVYKANWSHETTLYIASRRFVERTGESTPVTVYTNCDSVELLVNDVSKGVIKRSASNQGILIWNNVPLENKGATGSDACKNTVIAKGKRSGVEYADTVVWQRALSSATSLSSTALLIDNTNRIISLYSSVQAENINQVITPAAGATFVLVAADGVTPVTSGSVAPGMKLIVTPEDGVTIAVYEFYHSTHIAKGKSAKADSQENATNTPNKAVDGDMATRWAAPNNATSSAPHWLEVDLGKDYVINQVNVLWFDSESNHRAYQYTVLARKGNETVNRTIADQSNNSAFGFVSSIVQDEIAQHIRISSIGTKENAAYNYTSICELQVYGWSIASNSYTIDYANHTINVPFSSEIIPETDFLNNLTFEGVQKYRKSGGAYYIMAGDSLFVTDSNGKETAFEIQTSQTALSSIDANFQQVAVTNAKELIHIQLLKGTSAFLKISEPSGKRIVLQQIGKKFSYPLPQGIYLIEVDDNEKNSTKLKYILH